MRNRKHLLAVVTVLAAVVSGWSVSDEATAAEGCARVRPYALVLEQADNAFAGAVGNSITYDSDSAQETYTLEISDRMTQYMHEAVAGGCLLEVKFDTRLSVGVLNDGTAWTAGSYTVDIPGNPLVTDTVEARYPLEDCVSMICQKDTTHHVVFPAPLAAGTVITLTTASTATASAEPPSTANQASAFWDLRYPVLLIPIP